MDQLFNEPKTQFFSYNRDKMKHQQNKGRIVFVGSYNEPFHLGF